MTTTKSTHEKAYQKYAWVILFVTGILLALGAVFLVAASGPDMFEVDTGVAWAEFSDAYPSVATAYQLEQRLAYISGLGLALFALVITLVGFRQRHQWAWYAMWLLPGWLTIVAILLALYNQVSVGMYYLVLAAIAVIGLLLPIRKFFPKNRREPAAA